MEFFKLTRIRTLIFTTILFTFSFVCPINAVYSYLPGEASAINSLNKEDSQTSEKLNSYIEKRNALIEADVPFAFDQDITLTPEEKEVNTYLVDLRKKMIADYKESNHFPVAMPFYKVKDEIEKTELYSILKCMPKGGLLHVHRSAMGSPEWIVKSTYRDNSYVLWGEPAQGSKYIKGQIGVFNPDKVPEGFIAAAKLRKDIPDFDNKLLNLIVIGPDNDNDSNVWPHFSKIFKRISIPMHYKPIYVDYLRDAFKKNAADNIQYIEIRTGLSELIDLEGNTYHGEDLVKILLSLRDETKTIYPQFDLKMILAGYKKDPAETVKNELNLVKELQKKYPGFIIGYDQVGEEDSCNSILYYTQEFLNNPDIDYYFHAGESNQLEDKNIFDAYLLNSKRIGHGLNLYYFPELEQAIKEKDIVIELCPISNQLLGYISDLRQHPGRGYLKKGIQCVICSDDPAIFRNNGLTYDFWEAFIAWELDLKALKKLCINSIQYSGMNETEKEKALVIWQKQWDEFIKSFKK